jgi:putative NADPH-quinone reductase
MTLSILLASPNPGSFNHALADAIAQTATAAGHTVILHDLYAERFDPVLPAGEIPRDAALPPEIEQHCREIEQADGIAIVHPNWWSAPPAILRGWVDRCLRPGRAYNFVPDGQGGAKPIGLLKARSALVINTANTPQEKEEAFLGDPLQTHWLKVVFGLCGVPNVLRRNFAPVIVSSAETRAAWLQETRHLTLQAFPLQPHSTRPGQPPTPP